jgi:hypothetical protein
LTKWFASSPPPDPVVEIERVPGDVDQERGHEQDVERIRVAVAPPPAVQPPADRDDQPRERIGERLARHGLALELGQLWKENGKKQETDQRCFQGEIDPERDRATHK